MLPRTLQVSADGRFAIYGEKNMLDSLIPDSEGQPDYWLLDGKTGKRTAVASLLPPSKEKRRIQAVAMAPGGSSVLIAVASPRAPMPMAYVAELGTPKVSKIAEQAGAAVWAGDKVAVTSVTAEGLAKIQLIDPKTRKARTLDVRAIPVAASSDGSVLLAMGDPKDPTAKIRREDIGRSFSTFRAILVTAEGKVLRSLGQRGRMSQHAVISPKGKYVAYQQKSETRGLPASKAYSILVVRVADGKERVAEGYNLALGVTDEGGAIIRRAAYDGPENGGEKIVLSETSGKSRVLAERTGPSVVVGGRVFFVTPADRDPKILVIGSVDIPAK